MRITVENLQRHWFEEVWNNGREELIDELVAEDCIGHGLVDTEGNEVQGREAFRSFYQNFRSAFPDIKIEVQESISQGDLAVVLCNVTATHTGPGFVVPATGRPISFSGLNMVRIRDGQIAESWNHFDFLTVMQQLGVVG